MSAPRNARFSYVQSSSDDWEDIVRYAKPGETYKVSMDQMVKGKKSPREINVNGIREGDLRAIRSRDPFLYYSIPAVRSAKMLLKDIDVTNLGRSAMERSCHQSVVKRCTCMSFECHPDLLLADDLMEDWQTM